MTRIEVFHSLWTSSAPALNYVDLLTIVAPPVSFRIVRRLTHRAPPSSRAQEIRYFLHRVVRASIYHDTYARLSSPLSPFERRQKNHEPPSCCCVYTNFQRTTKASLAGVCTHRFIQTRSKLANIFRRARLPFVARSRLKQTCSPNTARY